MSIRGGYRQQRKNATPQRCSEVVKVVDHLCQTTEFLNRLCIVYPFDPYLELVIQQTWSGLPSTNSHFRPLAAVAESATSTLGQEGKSAGKFGSNSQ